MKGVGGSGAFAATECALLYSARLQMEECTKWNDVSNTKREMTLLGARLGNGRGSGEQRRLGLVRQVQAG